MALVAVCDACVLYPAALRDTLIRLSLTGLVRARWSDTILDEWERSILRVRPDLDHAALRRTRELMNIAVPDAVITFASSGEATRAEIIGGAIMASAAQRACIVEALEQARVDAFSGPA